MGIFESLSSFFNKDKESKKEIDQKENLVFDDAYIVFSPEDVDTDDYWGFVDEMQSFAPVAIRGKDYTNPNNTPNLQLREFLKDISNYLPPANGSYGASREDIEARGIEYIGDTEYKIMDYGIEVTISGESKDKTIMGKKLDDFLFDKVFSHGLYIYDYAIIVYGQGFSKDICYPDDDWEE